MNKGIRKLCRSLLAFVVLMALLTCSGCGKEAEQGKTDTTETETKTTWEDEEVQYRVCITGDVHFTFLNDAYGWQYEDRVQLWVDFILEEHEKEPFDLIIINGDTSLDYRANGGTITKYGLSTTAQFVDNYVTQLPEGVPVIILPGNHEQYSDEVWQKLTGNGRSTTYVLGDNLFVMPDSFGVESDPDFDTTGTAEPISAEYVQNAMDEYPNHNVYIISHEIDMEKQYGAFWRIVNKDNVIGLFSGHTHQYSLLFPELAPGKVIAQTGCFAWNNNFTGADGKGTWGIRDLIITENHAVSRYLLVECALVVDGKPTSFPSGIDSVIEYY